MKKPNIDNALPQHISQPKTNYTFSFDTENQKKLAKAIVDSIFAAVEDQLANRDSKHVKNINLILGRLHSLFDAKLDEYSQQSKDTIKDSLLEVVSADEKIEDTKKDTILDITKKFLNEPIVSLKTELKNFFSKNNLSTQSNDVLDTIPSLSTSEEDDIFTIPNEDEVDMSGGKNNIENIEVNTTERHNVDKSKVTIPKKNKKPTSVTNDGLLEVLETSKSYILNELFILNNRINRYSFNLTETNKKIIKKFLNHLNTAIGRFYSLTQMIDKSIDFLWETVYQYEKVFQQYIDFLAASLKQIIKAGYKLAMKMVPTIISAYYGPPAFIGVIVLAVSALVCLLSYLISSHIEKFTWFFSKVIPVIATVLKVIATTVIPPILSIGPFIIKIFKAAFDFLAKKFKPAVHFVFYKIVKPVIKFIMKCFSDIIRPLFDKAVELIDKYIFGAFQWIQKAFNYFRENIWSLISKVIIWIQDIIMKFVNKFKDYIKQFIDFVVDSFLSFFDNVLIPLFKYVLPALKELLEFLKPYIGPAVDFVMDLLLFICKLLKPVVIAIANFLANAFIFLIDGIHTALTWLKEKILSPIFSFVDVIANLGQYIYDKFMAIVPDWVINGLKALKNAAKAVWNGVKAVGRAIANAAKSTVRFVKNLFGWGDDTPKDPRDGMSIAQLKAENVKFNQQLKQAQPLIELIAKIEEVKKVSQKAFTRIIDVLQIIEETVSQSLHQVLEQAAQIFLYYFDSKGYLRKLRNKDNEQESEEKTQDKKQITEDVIIKLKDDITTLCQKVENITQTHSELTVDLNGEKGKQVEVKIDNVNVESMVGLNNDKKPSDKPKTAVSSNKQKQIQSTTHEQLPIDEIYKKFEDFFKTFFEKLENRHSYIK